MSTAYTTRQGFVYVLSNPNLTSKDGKRRLLKIGATRKHPIQRARELGAGTGVPGEFTLAYYRDFSDCFLAETLLHHRLGEYRVNESREFFDVGLDQAIQAIDGLALERYQKAEGDEELASQGLTGGDPARERLRAAWREVAEYPTPWAELFASFGPSESNELTPEEQSRCQELAARLREG